MPEIIDLNDELKSICEERYVTLIDTYTPFLEDRQMDTALTTDGTHLNYEGYKKYVDVLNAYVLK